MVISNSNTPEAAEELIHRARVLVGTPTQITANLYANSGSTDQPARCGEWCGRRFHAKPKRSCGCSNQVRRNCRAGLLNKSARLPQPTQSIHSREILSG